MKNERFFKHEDYEFLFLLTLGAAYRGGADLGECLVTAARVTDGDPESWYAEWKATADRIAEGARSSEETGHPVSARAAWLRASTYPTPPPSSSTRRKTPTACFRPGSCIARPGTALRRCSASSRSRSPTRGRRCPAISGRPAHAESGVRCWS
jgi:hypothetical protein